MREAAEAGGDILRGKRGGLCEHGFCTIRYRHLYVLEDGGVVV